MQLPTRKSQQLRQHQHDDERASDLLTPTALERLKETLTRLETVDRPTAVEDVSRSVQLGDLSENAEYQEAKSRLARTDGRIFSLKERIKRAILIQPSSDLSGRVHLGSTVTVEVDGTRKTYRLVGPSESNPAQGRISHLSPLGSALMNHIAGEQVTITLADHKVTYRIHAVTQG